METKIVSIRISDIRNTCIVNSDVGSVHPSSSLAFHDVLQKSDLICRNQYVAKAKICSSNPSSFLLW